MSFVMISDMNRGHVPFFCQAGAELIAYVQAHFFGISRFTSPLLAPFLAWFVIKSINFATRLVQVVLRDGQPRCCGKQLLGHVLSAELQDAPPVWVSAPS